MGSSGRYWCRPLPLFSISYALLAHCHRRGLRSDDEMKWISVNGNVVRFLGATVPAHLPPTSTVESGSGVRSKIAPVDSRVNAYRRVGFVQIVGIEEGPQ